MSGSSELCRLSIAQLAGEYRARRLSPVEVTHAYLDRITALDPVLCTYITVTADQAAADARASEARIASGNPRSALEGVPLGLKDIVDTAGVRTTSGSRLHTARVPTADAATVVALKDAGAVVLGKQTLHELACGGPARDGVFPAARNPWDTSRIPGGSSSGSAAGVAAGLCAGALGTDTAGSVRYPAGMCGVVGLKPSFGLVSRVGVVPLALSLDHVGPITRSVEDASILLAAVAGFDARDPASVRREPATVVSPGSLFLEKNLSGTRIGLPLDYVNACTGLDPQSRAAFDAAVEVLRHLGAAVDVVDIPPADDVLATYRTILSVEAFEYHQPDYAAQPDLYGRRFARLLCDGAAIGAEEYRAAAHRRQRMSTTLATLMGEIDVLALPTTPAPAHELDSEADAPRPESGVFTALFNLTGQPAVAVPCGFTREGLPISLQLAGRLFEDAALLAVAAAFECAGGWSNRHPAIHMAVRP